MKRPLKIGLIDNVSTKGYQLVAPKWPHELTYGSPAYIAQFLFCNTWDVALIPVGIINCLPSNYIPLDYGIAADRLVRSVILNIHTPTNEIGSQDLLTYFGNESVSSALMCKILFQRTFGKQCLEVSCRRDSAAELLIGNSGFEFWAGLRRSRNDFGSQILDIGQWWFSEFGLPAVFATWVVNKNLEPKLFSQVNEWLHEVVELCDSNIGIKLWANEISHDSIDIEIAKEFIYGLRYKLTREDRQSINILWDHLDAAQVTG